MKKCLKLLAFSLTLLAVSGCSYKVSDRIPKDGIVSRDEVKFPDPKDISRNGPTYPSLENLRKIEAGMSKDEIKSLIDHPHFDEGLYGVIEWDYLFNLKQAAKEEDKICQFKIIFDNKYKARSFFYEPQSCQDLVNTQNFTISNDILFDFAKSTLKQDGVKEINNIISQINSKKAKTIKIVGHTDMIGKESSNLVLSFDRAKSVKDEFTKNGFDETIILFYGVGESEPVKECDKKLKKQELIECLAPNRRVNIIVKN
ncbi:OmpA family protein [Campylobacter sp. FMV-PI01]|uniref:OmpA family protein n=1 Tax=Campylobacter portucalensis TaxID=2608384 RepID=A0A6L5WFR0_9BACT|nr:OmpA family protein [Campylobacter portucalensis]MSN95930.1 OmpA family protein [Campylobacter portucalensis]